MRLRAFFGIVFTILTLLSSRGVAAMPDNAASGYTSRLWQATDGLPDQSIYAFAQTPDGYLWIGTGGGLLRFDGTHFVVYDHENSHGLTESGINCLTVTRDGALWIGTEGGGAVRYFDHVFVSFPTAAGVSNSFVRAIYQDSRGVIWVGGDQGLFQVSGNHLNRIDGSRGVPAVFVRSILQDHQGRIWVGGTSLLQFDGSSVRDFPLPQGPSKNLVNTLLESRDGVIWVGTISGLFELRPSGRLRRVRGIASSVHALYQLSDGSLWIGSVGQGIFVRRGNAFSRMSAPSPLPSNAVLNIFEDRENNVWLGTAAGMLRLSKSQASIIPFPGTADSEFETIYQDYDGAIWVAARHLFRLGKTGAMHQEVISGLPHVRVRTLLRDRNNDLWVGTNGSGLFHIAGTHVTHFTSLNGLTNDFIRAILQSRDGTLWVGTDGGVSHLTSRGIVNYNVGNGLSYFSITALLEDRRGDIWIGTNRGLNHLHHGFIIRDEITRALEQQKIWSVHEDPDGGVWFGTSSGLYGYRSGKLTHFTTAQGLASNVVYQILEDSRSNFWLASPNTVSRLNRNELEQVQQTGKHLELSLYPVSGDMNSAQLYGGMQPEGFVSDRGDVWFVSNKGPLHIHVAERQARQLPPPPVVIDKVVADGRDLPLQPKIIYGPGDGWLEISYAAMLLRSQEGLRYRYFLEGFDKSWTDALSRRTAYYTKLPPGTYHFRVKAFEVDNPAAASEAMIEIVQRPHFYNTMWFLACCLLAIACCVWSAYAYRLRQLKIRFQAVLSERNRLAREMHDTLIQGCAGVSALLETAYDLDPAENDLRLELMDYARIQVRRAIDEARQAVWNLRHTETPPEGIDSLVRKAAQQVGIETGVAVQYQITGAAFPIGSSETRELIMIVREALSNAAVHGHPRRIKVDVVFSKNELSIEIQDDGNGFDLAARLAEDPLHYGLIGMRERVERLGGIFHLQTSVGQGTEVHIRVPRNLQRAELPVPVI